MTKEWAGVNVFSVTSKPIGNAILHRSVKKKYGGRSGKAEMRGRLQTGREGGRSSGVVVTQQTISD